MTVPSDPEKRAQYLEKLRQRAQERWNNSEYREKASTGFFKKGQTPHNVGKSASEEQRAKMSKAHKGLPAHNKGVPMSDEQKTKISASRKGKKRSAEAEARAAESNRGRKRTPETCAKIGAKHKDKIVSIETREKISKAGKGRVSNRKGAIISKEQREKLAAHGRRRWENKTPEEKAKHAEILREAARDITNSWIEGVVAQRLDAQGVVYEQQKLIGWYRVDFFIEAENRVIEVCGCYWHACEQCEHKINHIAGYEQKREKDKKRYEYLKRKGYTVEVIWEHDLPRKR